METKVFCIYILLGILFGIIDLIYHYNECKEITLRDILLCPFFIIIWPIPTFLLLSEQHSMTIRRSYSNSILTSIGEFLIALIIILIATVSISKYCADYDYYNYVELKAQYKNYIVTNKYVRNSDTYVLELMNPFSKKTKEVYVRDYLYYNTYFVGDTIK